MGSTRATVYTWRVDVATQSALIVGQKRRQLRPLDKRLDVKPVAASLADAIVARRADKRLTYMSNGSVRVDIAAVIPETNKETTAAGRNRLRCELDVLLKPHGLVSVRPNVWQPLGVRAARKGRRS